MHNKTQAQMPIITLVVDNSRDKENCRYAINLIYIASLFRYGMDVAGAGLARGLVSLIKTYACKSAVAVSIGNLSRS